MRAKTINPMRVEILSPFCINMSPASSINMSYVKGSMVSSDINE